MVAVPRLVEMYKRYEIRQTFFMPGWVMERYPAIVEAIVEGGHEIGLHGYIHELANGQPTLERERYWLDRVDAVRREDCRSPAGGLAGAAVCLLPSHRRAAGRNSGSSTTRR